MRIKDITAVLELLGELTLERFSDEVRRLCDAKDPSLGYYTPHAASHFSGVEQAVEDLLAHQKALGSNPETDATRPPSNVERLILRFCCWGHDVGMVPDVSEQFRDNQKQRENADQWSAEWARKHHDEASSYFITDQTHKIAKKILADYAVMTTHLDLTEPQKAQIERDIKNHQEQFLETYKQRGFPDGLVKSLIEYIEIEKNHDAILAHLAGLAITVALIASFHRRNKSIELCPLHRDVLGVTVRARFLAAVFRLADALHVDRSRFSYEQFERIRYQPDFSAEARRHWMKSYLVSSISVNPITHSLDVQMDLPDRLYIGGDGSLPSPLAGTAGDDMEKKRHTIAGMRDFILNDLEEDLFSVSGILLEHSFPPILRVVSNLHAVPSMVYLEDIWSVLDDLNVSASPNTSQVMNAALGSFKDIYTEATFLQQKPLASAHSRLESLREMLEKRRCHEGVNKIRALLEAIVMIFSSQQKENRGSRRAAFDSGDVKKGFPDHTPVVHGVVDRRYISEDEFLMVCLEGAYTTFKEQRTRCKQRVKEGDLDSSLPIDAPDLNLNLILYGYSEQAIEVLRRLFLKLKRLPTVYVLECRTKTQYTPTGRLIYHDGIRYASAIRDELGPSGRIVLIPDFAIGRVLEESCASSNEKTLILLGSNAVTLDGHLVHSMGHASVAAAAKSPRYRDNTEVYVLTDGLKIGGTIQDVKKHEDIQRNERHWLSHDARALQAADRENIITTNWQEDVVNRAHIDYILVLDHSERIEANSANACQRIAELEFKPDLDFNAKLQIRIVASRLRKNFEGLKGDAKGLFKKITDSEPLKGKPVKDIDELCYILAEKTWEGKLDSLGSAVDHPAWKDMHKRALEGCNETLTKGIAEFTQRLSDVYKKVLRDTPDKDEPEPPKTMAVAAGK